MSAIVATNIGKCYSIYRQPADRALEWLTGRQRHIEKWALRNLYFRIEPGSIVGVIGANGSGKTTLARLLTGISDPTEGTVQTSGRVAGVIELGSGFHPDFTGRDNVRMAASFHGFSGDAVGKILDRVIDFSELGEAIDHPVRTYSSGMFLRLGFSLAVSTDADILVFDEVLAVGDEYFRGKCFNHINDLHREGKSIVFVSHDMSAVRSLCDWVLLLEDGCITKQGAPEDVALDYIGRMRLRLQGRNLEGARTHQLRWGSGAIRVEHVRLYNESGESETFLTGEPMVIEAGITVNQDVNRPVFGNGIFRSDGTYVSGFNHLWHRTPVKIELLQAGRTGIVRCRIPSLPLLAGKYFISYYCYDHSLAAPQPIDHIEHAARFTVLPGPIEEHGTVHIESEWDVQV